MAVKFFYNDVQNFKLDKKARLKLFIAEIFKVEGKNIASLTYVFCSDDFLLSMNRDFLDHNFFTDIITFDLSTSSARTDGEIYISIDRVKENALKYRTNTNEELHRVIFHGALHLCGYKDKTAAEKRAMTLAENKYLALYFA